MIAPFALILLTGNYRLLRKPGLYVAAAIVLVVAAPPLYIAYQLDAPLGDFSPLTWPLLESRVVFYAHYVWQELGTVTLLLAAVGARVALSRQTEIICGPARHQTAALVALTTGAFAFHFISPHTMSSGRYITLAVAPILALIALGVMTLADYGAAVCALVYPAGHFRRARGDTIDRSLDDRRTSAARVPLGLQVHRRLGRLVESTGAGRERRAW